MKQVINAMVGSVVIKRKYGTCVVIVTIVMVFYGTLHTSPTQSDDGESYDGILASSDYENIKNDIALEIKSLFRPTFGNLHAKVENLKSGKRLLPNPDPRYHSIKKNKPVVFKTNPLNISKLALLFKGSHSIDPPTANASLLVQDLQDRWKIAGYILRPKQVEAKSEKRQFSLHQCFKPPESRGQWKMITLIKSQIVNMHIRNAIRETWGSVEKLDGIEMNVVFLLARASSLYQQYKLSVESEKHGDILQINLPETAMHYTGRTISGMRWVSQYFPSHCILSVLDDNMFISLQNVLTAVSHFIDKSPSIENSICKAKNIFPFLCGYSLRENDPPLRDSKSPWFVSEKEYPPSVYPPHCQGSFYLTSVSTVNLILDVATKTRIIQLDAMWITGILRQKLGLHEDSVQDGSASMKFALLARFLKKDIAQSIRHIWKAVLPQVKKKNVVFKKAPTNTLSVGFMQPIIIPNKIH